MGLGRYTPQTRRFCTRAAGSGGIDTEEPFGHEDPEEAKDDKDDEEEVYQPSGPNPRKMIGFGEPIEGVRRKLEKRDDDEEEDCRRRRVRGAVGLDDILEQAPRSGEADSDDERLAEDRIDLGPSEKKKKKATKRKTKTTTTIKKKSKVVFDPEEPSDLEDPEEAKDDKDDEEKGYRPPGPNLMKTIGFGEPIEDVRRNLEKGLDLVDSADSEEQEEIKQTRTKLAQREKRKADKKRKTEEKEDMERKKRKEEEEEGGISQQPTAERFQPNVECNAAKQQQQQQHHISHSPPPTSQRTTTTTTTTHHVNEQVR
ncbi:hypothetical protein HKX48_008318 [Thoreauomyces humboldtii]|nr:hypothetical protein HKX48_008318 [Thoreauomyces humboldtii]